jgi:hypothetical protein
LKLKDILILKNHIDRNPYILQYKPDRDARSRYRRKENCQDRKGFDLQKLDSCLRRNDNNVKTTGVLTNNDLRRQMWTSAGHEYEFRK